MKERFSAEEWAELQTIPIQAFVLVAGADGKVDKKEREAFAERLAQDAVADPDPLMRALAMDVVNGFDSVFRRSAQSNPTAAKQVLRSKLTTQEYQSFLGSVFADALHVGRASSGRILRKKKVISDKERENLTAFALFWDLDPQAFLRDFVSV